MKKILFALMLLVATLPGRSQGPFQQFEGLNFSKVEITDRFWRPKMDKVTLVTLPACIYQTEIKTPRIRNFEKVARHKGEKFEGVYYDDSDVYKALEAIAYSLGHHPDSSLMATADRWIDKIAAAQQPDGYLDTYFTLTDLASRWTQIEKHEDYCAGHLIEAAVAYYNATGKTKLLEVAKRLANHIDSTFRLQNRYWISGHEEIELALMKLYHATGEDRYLKLADWYLSQRGKGYNNGKGWGTPAYWQDMAPVKAQTQITGHAVRAMYLYTGAADVAAATGDTGYIKAMKAVWEDVTDRNMYFTGGIGSSGDNEGFSTDYDLPNEQAYCETCASVGMVFWNQRMAELTGDGRYVDVLEKSLYNGALDGLSLSGDRFFYDNPLASNGEHKRSEWFGTACCPANIARLVASLGNYIYGQSKQTIWVNLFVGSRTELQLDKTLVGISTETAYPLDGGITIKVDPAKKTNFSLRVRVPGWLNGQVVPGAIYQGNATGGFSLLVNGQPAALRMDKGYAVVTRDWKKGDLVQIRLAMQAQLVHSTSAIRQDQDRLAVQRGPLVYCVEGADNHGQAWNILLPPSTQWTEKKLSVLDEPVVALQASLPVLVPGADGTSISTVATTVTAIPYYTWCNRGSGPMQVWLPTRIKDLKLNF